MGNKNSGRKPQERCVRGHLMEYPNVIIVKRRNGKVERACRTCRNDRQREYYHRSKNGKRTDS